MGTIKTITRREAKYITTDVVKYQTSDYKEFDLLQEAEEHENIYGIFKKIPHIDFDGDTVFRVNDFAEYIALFKTKSYKDDYVMKNIPKKWPAYYSCVDNELFYSERFAEEAISYIDSLQIFID